MGNASAIDVIKKLIAQAEQWKAEHVLVGREIEAAACEIRIRALLDAFEALEG